MGNDQGRYVLAPTRFVFLGDSITEASKNPNGWATHVAKEYSRRAEIVVRGFSGYNSRWALATLDAALPPGGVAAADAAGLGPVKLVTVFFGANDSVLLESNEKQHVPINEYKSNLAGIVQEVRKRYGSDVAIVLLTPPPCNTSKWPSRLPENTASYAKTCRDVAGAVGLPCIDLHSLFLAQPDYNELLSDGLHLSDAGNKLVADELVSCVAKHFPHLASKAPEMPEGKTGDPNPLPPHLPHHDDVTGQNQTTIFQSVVAEINRKEADSARVLTLPPERATAGYSEETSKP